MKKLQLTGIMLLLLLPGAVKAIDLSTTYFPDKIPVRGVELLLNGSGFRKVTFFRIKVYALGLYLSSRTSNPGLILGSSATKKLLLHFVRSVGKERLYSALEESVVDNYPDWPVLHNELQQLQINMPDVESGDSIEFYLYPEAVHVSHNREREIVISSQKLQEAILSIWLGPDPAGTDLKEALLSGNRD